MHLRVGCVACHLGKLLKALTANCVGLVDYTIAILYLHRVAEMLPYCWLKWGGRVRNLWVGCHVSSRSSSTSSTFAGRRHMIGKVVTGCVVILPYHTATQDRGSECRDFGFISRIVTALDEMLTVFVCTEKAAGHLPWPVCPAAGRAGSI